MEAYQNDLSSENEKTCEIEIQWFILYLRALSVLREACLHSIKAALLHVFPYEP